MLCLHLRAHCAVKRGAPIIGVIGYIKTDDPYNDIAEDFETSFDTSNYELDRSLPKGKNKKVIGLIKDELGGKVMIKFVG